MVILPGDSNLRPVTKQLFKDAWSFDLHQEIWDAIDHHFASDISKLFEIIEDVTSLYPNLHALVPSASLLQQAWLARLDSRCSREEGLAISYQQINVASGNADFDSQRAYVVDTQKHSIACTSYHPTRKLLSTSRCMIGLASERVQVGDEIWLLAGARVPYVIRRQQNGLTIFVCAAYIDGVMRGERWPTEVTTLESLSLV